MFGSETQPDGLYGELVPCGGGDPIPMRKTKLLVGRRSRCDIMLEFPNISSQHCEFELINGYWCVRDLGSRNGIKVNGVRCDTKWLMPGDIVAVAKHRFEINYTPSTDAPPPEEANPFELSLMEKAGLLRKRPAERPSSRPSPPANSAAPETRKKPQKPNDDDLAMKWLSGE